jgi:hypothetical protein
MERQIALRLCRACAPIRSVALWGQYGAPGALPDLEANGIVMDWRFFYVNMESPIALPPTHRGSADNGPHAQKQGLGNVATRGALG